MKKRTSKIAILFFIVFALIFYSNSFASDSPKDIVSRFCKLDFDGNRLASATYDEIGKIVSYPAEPGWDIAIGIHSYKILSEKIEGNIAKVNVHYEIDRSWPSDFDNYKEYQKEVFFLNKVGGEWKISKFIVYPRVSKSLLCSKYNYCSDR